MEIGKPGAAATRLEIPKLESFTGILEAQTRKRAADGRLRENETKVKRIQDGLALRAQGITSSAPIRDRAEASLRGEPVSTALNYSAEDLHAARDEHEVLAEACVIAADSLRELVG